MAATKNPTIVLVHGAWHCPEQYSRLTDRLSKDGFKVKPVRLPSVAPTEVFESFAPDVDAIRKEIQTAIDSDEDVIIVCHSYGGIPSSEAAKDFLKKDRVEQGLKRGIVTMVYMCAFALDVGETLADAREIVLETTFVEPSAVRIDNPVEAFYNDVDADTIAEIVPKLAPQAVAPFVTKVSFAPWKEIPCTYVLCELDMALGLSVQEKFTNPSRGGKWTVHRLHTGHSPFLNAPGDVSDIVQQASKQAYI